MRAVTIFESLTSLVLTVSDIYPVSSSANRACVQCIHQIEPVAVRTPDRACVQCIHQIEPVCSAYTRWSLCAVHTPDRACVQCIHQIEPVCSAYTR